MTNDCEFCGEHPTDCRCLDLCPACGLECSCEVEPPRFDAAPALDATPDDAAQTEQYLSVWGGRALRESLPK